MATVVNITSQMAEARSPKKPLLSNAVFGTLVFVLTEVMFFMGLISSFIIIKARYGSWAPPEGITLPVEATALNTGILFLSAIYLFMAGREIAKKPTSSKVGKYLIRATVLAAFFVTFQGYEWVQLLKYGMTIQSGTFGATFYVIIGAHAVHVLSAVLVMISLYFKFKKGLLTDQQVYAMQVFWFFVVGIWPVLYTMIYF